MKRITMQVRSGLRLKTMILQPISLSEIFVAVVFLFRFLSSLEKVDTWGLNQPRGFVEQVKKIQGGR